MPDIVTSKTFVDGEKGITAAKLNQITSGAVIQPAFYSAKPSSPTLDPTDVFLELKANGAFAQISGAQIASSVAGQLALADTTQNGMLRKLSGLATDFVDGTNNCQDLISAVVSKRFNRLQLHDDCSYPIIGTITANGQLTVGPIPWYLVAATSAGGGVASVYSGAGQDINNKVYGEYALLSGAVLNNYVVLDTSVNLISGLGALDLYFRFGFGRLPTATDNFIIKLGLTDSAASPTNACLLIMTYNATPAAPCWLAENIKAGVPTTGALVTSPPIAVISPTAFSMYNAHISIDATWTTATFFVNGTQIGVAIGGLPAAGTLVCPYLLCQKTAGSLVQGSFYVDDVFIDYQYVTP
jgi:hypothetical protein